MSSSEGEVKFWLVPDVQIARNHGLSEIQLSDLKHVVEEKRDEILEAWRRHFTD